MKVPPRRTVDMRPLKNSMLRELVISEADELDAEEYLIKMGVWLRLLRFEGGVAESR